MVSLIVVTKLFSLIKTDLTYHIVKQPAVANTINIYAYHQYKNQINVLYYSNVRFVALLASSVSEGEAP